MRKVKALKRQTPGKWMDRGPDKALPFMLVSVTESEPQLPPVSPRSALTACVPLGECR